MVSFGILTNAATYKAFQNENRSGNAAFRFLSRRAEAVPTLVGDLQSRSGVPAASSVFMTWL